MNEFYYIIPFIIAGAGILVSLVVEMYSGAGKKILPWTAILSFLSTGFYALSMVNTVKVVFQDMLMTGGNAYFFIFVFNIGAALVVLLSIGYLEKYGAYYGEFYILLQSAVLGMMFMAAAKDLLVIFMGLELMSICFYALAGINRKKLNANESALKYFLLGAFATGFVVYGMALVYGVLHTTSLDFLFTNFPKYSTNILLITGLLFILIGFSFKIAAFPFHMWVPDVYQGASTVVSAIMSTGGKAAAFSAIIVSFASVLTVLNKNVFAPYFAAIAVFSMLYGSIVAIAQTDIKRMLAYSSIAHAGYMAIGLASGSNFGVSGIIFYLTAYTFMNIGAFGIISIVEGKNDTNLTINSYAGLAHKNPLLAALMALLMFALAGIPPFAGFFGKYYVFISAIKADMTWLAIIGVISSAISVYFYLRIVVLMYFKEAETELTVEKTFFPVSAVIISVVWVVLLGLFPNSFINLISYFSR
jgi:NADH-quinone oxidoreductase subunit N